MASASEGKTLATPTKACDICQSNVSIKYCSECCLVLCRICSHGHHLIPATKHHTLSDLTSSGKSDIVNPADDQLGKCPKHDTQLLNTLCQNCSLLICDLCLPEHRSHNIQPLNSDPKICQQLCTKQIQQLLDELQEAEEIKSILESNITTYEESAKVVDKWELDLLQMVKTKASRLRQKLKKIKDDKSKLLTDKVNGLVNKLKEINKTITKLNEIRQGIDIHILTNELSRSYALMTKLQVFKGELKPIPKKLYVKEILKTGNKIKDIENDIDVLFSIADIQDSASKTTPKLSKTSAISPGIERKPFTPTPSSPVMSGPEMARLMTPGTRVVRGDDWSDGNNHGPPTMIGTVTRGVYGLGHVCVKWDHGGDTHIYRMGSLGMYELQLLSK